MNFRYPTIEETLENETWENHFIQRYGFQFFQPSFDKVPYVSSLVEDENVGKYFKFVENYLLYTYPINLCTNISGEVSKLKHKLNDNEFSKLREINKLAPNRWGSIVHFLNIGLSNLSCDTKKFKDNLGFDKLCIHHDSNCKGYLEYSFDKKLDIIRTLDTLAYRVLERIYNEYS